MFGDYSSDFFFFIKYCKYFDKEKFKQYLFITKILVSAFIRKYLVNSDIFIH